MSTHPNVILLLTLTPRGLARKTMADILKETRTAPDDDLTISGEKYHHKVMESDYDEGWQIGAAEGDLIFFDLVTYGYGEQIEWERLEIQKNDLQTWANGICDRHNCSSKISVTANYW